MIILTKQSADLSPFSGLVVIDLGLRKCVFKGIRLQFDDTLYECVGIKHDHV